LYDSGALGSKDRNDETLTLAHQSVSGGTLLVGVGTAEEKRFPISSTPIVIGKDPAGDIVLRDPAVSRRHCEVKQTAVGVHIRDLGSRNGTIVGGVAMESGLLRHASTIRLGETDIYFLSDKGEEESDSTGPTSFGSAVGTSKAMRKVFALLERLAATDLSVTLIGETGTGKDVLARGLHSHSQRKEKDFVVFDAGAVAATLIESRLFGHMKGAFTGAVSDHKGQFEAADGGTLFLDEIGELNLDLQPKLLRALEQRTVVRLGGTTEIPVNVRIIAATNRDLEIEVKEGRFREDLFFRLGVAVVRVPPLRDRREDIPLLCEAFAKDLPRKVTLSDAALAVLQAQQWPGNVRELKNVLALAAAVSESDLLEPRDFLRFSAQPARAKTLDGLPLAGRTLDSIEKNAIKQTLQDCKGNKTHAAKALGIASSTLYEKIKKYGI
jgi:DNA-binding NtrC family response regulator